ncbi:MAG: Obg family GTPase CgtA, partial [Phycisphaerae bacterium]
SKNMAGRDGADLILKLPLGTRLFDRQSGLLIKDLSTPGEPVCVAEGGKGGRGNARFARADHQTPREYEPGTPGQERWLRLELSLIADVGFVGLPNAGKSTLLARLSKARPKIADYPFTTLEPQLGIAELSDHRRLVLADLPGLIEGAHKGAGLGDAFLRHIERTRVLVHLVDVGSPYLATTPREAYTTIRAELEQYGSDLAHKSEIVVATKSDLTGADEAIDTLSRELGKDVLAVSAVSGQGLSRLMEAVWKLVRDEKTRAAAGTDAATPMRQPPHRKALDSTDPDATTQTPPAASLQAPTDPAERPRGGTAR